MSGTAAGQPGRPVLAPPAPGPLEPLATRPTFAVVTAIYQGADVIAANAEAILSGTLAPDEYIICDDGSTDGLEEALAPFADRITLIRKANGGAASAYNVAIRAARSDFVVQTDHDDTFAPERLAAIAGVAQARPDLDVIATDATMELDGRVVGTYKQYSPFPVDDQRDWILRGCFFGWPAIRRELILSIGGFDERRRIDWDWDCWIKLILADARVGLIDEPLYRWRLRHESLSARVADNFREDIVMLELLLEEHASLTARDRTTIGEVIDRLRRRLVRLDAKASLLDRGDDVRRRQLDLLRAPDVGIRTRMKAAAAFVAPGVSRRILERQVARSATGGWSLSDR